MCLTAAEVSGAIRRARADAATFAHFLARQHQPTSAALAELKKLREQENRLVADVPEIMVMEEMPAARPAISSIAAPTTRPAKSWLATRREPAAVPEDQPRNRLGLARWLTDRQHPLTARVVVNRIWRMHFGRGIVPTQEDFGSQGKLPTHPELLDWLAAWFMDNGWDVKALHRLIVTSATFRQSSRRRASRCSAIRTTCCSLAVRKCGCWPSRFATARSPRAVC